jgi:hypothetical protein
LSPLVSLSQLCQEKFVSTAYHRDAGGEQIRGGLPQFAALLSKLIPQL